MPDILQTLHLESDPTTNVYPNILAGNIPDGAITGEKIAFSGASLYEIRPQTMAELVNILMKVLLEYNQYKVFYYRETEYGADFSTIDFRYDSTNNVLTMYVGGVTSTISDETSFNAFMYPYAKYVYIQKVGS